MSVGVSVDVSTAWSVVAGASVVVVAPASWIDVEVSATTFAAGATVVVATPLLFPLSELLLLVLELELLLVVFGTAVHRFPSRVVINPPAGRDMMKRKSDAVAT